MTAAELLRRAEERQRWSRVLFTAAGLFILVALFMGAAVFIHRNGVDEGRALEKRVAFEKALKHNAEQLRLAGLHRDTTKKEATAAVGRSTTHRDTSRGTVASVTPTSDTTLQVLSLPPLVLPKLAVDAYRDLIVGRRTDSLTIASLQADVAALETEKWLLEQRVGEYESHEKDHAGEVKSAGRRGFKKGAIVGTVATVLLGIIIFE